jgi:hypothetical protein
MEKKPPANEPVEKPINAPWIPAKNSKKWL